jgi:hypothetical protein
VITADPPGRARRLWDRVDSAAGGLAADLVLYAASTVFAALTAAGSTLPAHRAWGRLALVGYLVATLAAALHLLLRRRRLSRSGDPDPPGHLTGAPGRAVLVAVTWASTTLTPMLWQCVQRAGGRTDRAQEEVLVVERAGARLLDTGTPYLGRDAIAALPADERLLGYLPYQPGMALFGLPRAVAGNAWSTDARVWFAVVTASALGLAVLTLHRAARTLDSPLVRAAQFATVLPVAALTLATGGDDLPVLGLCLLALACCATGRPGRAGLAVGLAAALKLFAWPVLLVLLVHAVTRGHRPAIRFAAGAVGLPVLAMVPALIVDAPATVENVLRFPLGRGLVTSPAGSPLPGHLIAQALPAGRMITVGLLAAAGLAIAVHLLRRPPRTTATAAAVCGYGLLAAMLLMPATRFGYLLYPVALLTWVPALRPADPVTATPASPREPVAATA